MKIDNFALTMFQSCPAKYFLRIKEDWTSRRKAAALGFGGALHEGLKEWHSGHGPEAALRAIDKAWPDNLPIDDWRTKGKCLTTMAEYIKRYPKESFTIVGAPAAPLVEVGFTIDTGLFLFCHTCGSDFFRKEDEEPICQNCRLPYEPIEYGGIFDGLIEFSGSVYVLEHKSTSQLGQYYFNQFRPNNQITGYVWAAQKLSGRKVGGAIVNAIGVYKASATKFERQITTRSDAEIAEWLRHVQHTCFAIKQAERSGVWPMHTPACTYYGRCEFYDVHSLPLEDERQRMLEMAYVRREWDYENRDAKDDNGTTSD